MASLNDAVYTPVNGSKTMIFGDAFFWPVCFNRFQSLRPIFLGMFMATETKNGYKSNIHTESGEREGGREEGGRAMI